MSPIIICRNGVRKQDCKEYKRLIREIYNDIFSLPKCNLYVLLDDQNLEKWLVYKTAYGLYTYVKVGDIPPSSPSYILDITERDDCDHFIWIPKKGLSSYISLTWNYSHELQHLKQGLQNPNLLFLNQFFLFNMRDMPIHELRITIIPAEKDAEIAAKRAVTKKFGKDDCQKYIKSMGIEDIDKLDIDEHYEVEKETIYFLCKKENKYWFIQRQSTIDRSPFFNPKVKKIIKNLDLEEICRKKKIPS